MLAAARLIEDEGETLYQLKTKGEGLLMDLRSVHRGSAANVHQQSLEQTLLGFGAVYQKFVQLGVALSGAGSTAAAIEDALRDAATKTLGGGASSVSQINY